MGKEGGLPARFVVEPRLGSKTGIARHCLEAYGYRRILSRAVDAA